MKIVKITRKNHMNGDDYSYLSFDNVIKFIKIGDKEWEDAEGHLAYMDLNLLSNEQFIKREITVDRIAHEFEQIKPT